MPKVHLRDLDMNYAEFGEGKPEVILLTGLGGTMQNWVDNPGMVDAFKDSHRVVIMDNRGAGETSDGDVDYVTISTMAEDVIALMDYLEIEKPIILGGSMGGMIAQQIAVDHPDRVKKLILNATWPGGPNIVKPVQELWEYLTVPGMGGYDHLVETNPLRLVFSQKTLEEMDEDVLESIADTFFSVRTTDLVGFRHQQVALRDFNVVDRLCEVQCPTLVAHGLYDCLIPCENAITIAKLIPDAEFLLLPNSSHASIEDSELFQEAVVRFVEGSTSE